MEGMANPVVDAFTSLMAYGTDSLDRARRGMEVFESELDTTIADTPFEVVFEIDRVKLKHYRAQTKRKAFQRPLLVVYALINRETMLDLQPGRSVLEIFLESGLDVYMVDWGYPTRKDQHLTIDDHVNGYMDKIVDVVLEREELSALNLMGICMGGTFSTMYAALHPEKVNSLITTVTPTNFDTDAGFLHSWMRELDVDKLIGAWGNMPADVMNLGFLLLNPARLMLDKYNNFARNMGDRDFVENFVRMEKWIFDSPDVPGATFRQFITDCYQKNLLIQNKMVLGGKTVDLRNITMPLLNIYGKKDHLVPPEACNRLISAVGSRDARDLCIDTGHIGIYVSSRSQKEFAPEIIQWLADRETGRGLSAWASAT
ncbi:class III poly(R)-hydroxyalkanoic acid synthase subunit PhaC [Desulfoluna butyratoxydans]|uniref:Poly(3-hydroxyalkanoate) polymerase subunit PhaC n=1 Tax=Desulfoluna butyratoxydans TaxID=231438 RepID=A0A4U8YYR4_9BACT|nr:class III poly(R)-hydroxyalkanoic acid synthase subunit PhaC [Desulfoluna butyratoxydans]VFQ47362.1 poly(r)-hydroxyalkanoic acid synthase class iii phac subunit [Desulfoluna butyratoxydans]